MKKHPLIAWLLTLAMLFSLLPTAAFAASDEAEEEGIATVEVMEEPATEEVPIAEESIIETVSDEGYQLSTATSGTCGDNLTWTLDEDGVLTISGTGDMADYNSTEPSWYSSRTLITSVVIESGVTSIGACAFQSCTNLKSVAIPASVASIGNFAFYGRTGLKNVYITDLAAWCEIDYGEYVGNPLYYATNLYLNGERVADLTVPEGVTSIGDYAFYGYTGLTSITISDSVTSIGNYAFYNCTSLTDAVIPDSVTSMGHHAFYGCSKLESVELSKNLTYIAQGAFAGCTSLLSIHIPAKVKGIMSSAFALCSSLTTVTLPTKVVNVGISDYAFRSCSSLTDVYFAGSEAEAETIYISATGNTYLTGAVWHYNSELAAQDDGSEDIIDENATYYTVTYDGRGVADIPALQVRENDFASRPSADMSRSGYIFLGWYNGEEAWDFFTPITENITLTAKWEDEEQVSHSGGSMVDSSGYSLILVGHTQTLDASGVAAYDNITSVSGWSVPTGITVVDSSSTSMIVKATRAGTYTITANVTSSYTRYDALSKQNVTVYDTSPATFYLHAVDIISEITVAPSIEMSVGESAPLDYSTTPSGNYAKSMSGFSWGSSDTSVVTISEDGILTATGVGTATITLSTVTGSTDLNLTEECVVTVSNSGSGTGGESHTHSYTSAVTTASTCTTDGVTTYTCSCGDSYTETIPATGHTPGETVQENMVEATATENGSYDNVVYCTVCGAEISRETVTIPATGTGDSGTGDTGTGDTGTGDTDTGDTGTGDSGTVHAHSYTSAVTKAATCTTDGVMTYTCSCGASYTEIIPATDHTWDKGTVTLKATRYTEGEMTYTCTVCGATKTETIPQLTGSDAQFLFSDVSAETSSNNWYYEAVYWAYDLEITKGTSDTVFSPNAGCTRAQFATFLYRLAQNTGEDVSCDLTSSPFDDVIEGVTYTDFYIAILWA
ncbi:MAG: leucine-rich repeat protein [Oscillospiraceae bacterium]|nr:leucine-rich repeat protein [Oscillospiraceae bacterium]